MFPKISLAAGLFTIAATFSVQQAAVQAQPARGAIVGRVQEVEFVRLLRRTKRNIGPKTTAPTQQPPGHPKKEAPPGTTPSQRP